MSDSHVIQTRDPGLASSVYDMTLATWFAHGRLAPMHAQLRQWEGQLFSCTESQAEWNFYFSRPDIARMP